MPMALSAETALPEELQPGGFASEPASETASAGRSRPNAPAINS